MYLKEVITFFQRQNQKGICKEESQSVKTSRKKAFTNKVKKEKKKSTLSIITDIYRNILRLKGRNLT